MPMPDPSFGDPRERLLAALLAGQEGAQPLPEQPAGGGSGLGRNLSAVAALALGVLPATRLARAMFATAPRAIGTGLGTGLAFETAAGRGPLGVTPAAAQAPTPEVAAPPSAVPPPVTGPEPGPRVPGGSERVYQLQEELTREGYYTGRIDGRMGEGGPTERAKALRDAERDRQRAEAMATSGAEADRLRAEAEKLRGQAEAARVTQEGERGRERAAAERAGEERMAGVPSRISSRLIEALGTYGPIAGYIGGGALGHILQRGLAGRVGAGARATAAEADRVMGRSVANTDVPGRIGRVNEFWATGNPRRVEPFTLDPGRRPHPYVPTPDRPGPLGIGTTRVPTAGDLYQPTAGTRAMEALPVPALGLAEWGATQITFIKPYREELAAAEEALAKDPNKSESNIDRVQVARAKLAAAESVARVGFGMGIGSGGTTLTHMLGAPRARPSTIATAERERGRLTAILSKPPPKPRAAPRANARRKKAGP